MKITGIVITYNEERNIRECLESIKWLEEIVIVDSHSTDSTPQIAKHYTDKIFTIDITNVTQKRIFSLEKAANEWILFLDADERVTPELKDEILVLKNKQEEDITGYYINRKNFYLGKWIKHCGLCPDYHLRLFKKDYGAVTDRVVHEAVNVEGQTSRLKNHIYHYSYPDLNILLEKINYYSTLEAEEHFHHGKKISKTGAFTHGISAFLRVYISRMGFLDGIYGLYVSFTDACVNFLTQLKLLKLQNKI
ncbi:MAG: glycosyltransferase family 2 protein [Ignavibacteria bacterium]|jgi:glycosyltransferase involved in cell wall biosynthesis